MEKVISFLFRRFTLVSLAILAQIIILALMILKFSKYFFLLDIFFMIMSVLVVLYILNRRSDPTYKLAWIIPIMILPVLGGLFYVLLGGTGISNRMKNKMHSIVDKMKECLHQHPETLHNLRNENTKTTFSKTITFIVFLLKTNFY